jgi:predicted RNase H-like nuclease (RuvC/YqgF family)
MATAKKTPAEAPERASESVKTYRMPKDVSDWIEDASSRITYLTATVERLKEENKNLRASHKMMEKRVLGQSQE